MVSHVNASRRYCLEVVLSIIHAKALQIASKLSLPDFKEPNIWLNRRMICYSIRALKVGGESAGGKRSTSIETDRNSRMHQKTYRTAMRLGCLT